MTTEVIKVFYALSGSNFADLSVRLKQKLCFLKILVRHAKGWSCF